jgi:hypothetical protein
VSFGLFRVPMEQLMGGAWRLHTSSAVELDFPNRLGAAKTKSALQAGSAQAVRHSSCGTRRQWVEWELKGRTASFSRHPGRREVWEG